MTNMNNSTSLTRRSFISAGVLLPLVAVGDFSVFATGDSPIVALDSPDRLLLKGCSATMGEHRGNQALQLVGLAGNIPGVGGQLALIRELVFRNGTLEVELAGGPIDGPTPGFMGLAFHISEDLRSYEHVYLRPKNGRNENQLKRNHACQYASQPNFGWKKLREEFPGVYESYVDIEADAWTKMKLVIHGTTLRLLVNDAPQPCLVVNDLKLGETSGGVALWVDTGTRAFFRNLRVVNSDT
jgi:hypothetical protein